jgi:hypothetical protein
MCEHHEEGIGVNSKCLSCLLLLLIEGAYGDPLITERGYYLFEFSYESFTINSFH